MPDVVGAEASRPPVAARLRVVLCTRGGLYGGLVRSQLQACPEIELCALVRSTRVFAPQYGFLEGALQFVRRCGWRYAIYLMVATSLSELLGGLAWRARPEQNPSAPQPLRIATRNLNRPEIADALRTLGPDLLVSAFFDQKLHPQVLAIPRLGCINIHPSLLPGFRGVDPVLQAFAAGAREVGVTVHWMSEDFDCGPIVRSHPVLIDQNQSVLDVTARLFREGAQALIAALPDIRRRTPGTPQSTQGARYDSWPAPAEVARLRLMGVALWTLRDLGRLLGGLPPV